jgi:uncharacterized protein (DUF2147 family)
VLKEAVMWKLAPVLVLLAAPVAADPIEGIWRTAPDPQGRIGHVRIAPCESGLCGVIVRAFDTAGRPVDSPDVGRTVIWDTEPVAAGLYEGRVYSPGRQRSYESRLTLRGDSLLVEGCMMGQCRGGEPWARLD